MSPSNTPFQLGPWTFKLHFGSDILDFDAASFKETATVKATLAYIAGHQDEITAELLAAIEAEYTKALKDSDAYEPEELAEVLPPIDTPEDLLELVTPGQINIFETMTDGAHYVGFDFDCTWDDEHGLGVLTHLGQVVSHGSADTANLEWMAEEAAGKP